MGAELKLQDRGSDDELRGSTVGAMVHSVTWLRSMQARPIGSSSERVSSSMIAMSMLEKGHCGMRQAGRQVESGIRGWRDEVG